MSGTSKKSGIALLAWFQRNPGDWTKFEVCNRTGLSDDQFVVGKRWINLYGEIEYGVNLVCDKGTDTYTLTSALFSEDSNSTLYAYDDSLTRNVAHRTMTVYANARAAHARAILGDDARFTGLYRRRVRFLRNVLETYSEEAEVFGDIDLHEEIEQFLTVAGIGELGRAA